MATFIIDCERKVFKALSCSLTSHLVMPGNVSSCGCHFYFCNTQILLVLLSVTKLCLIRKATLPLPLM